MKLFLLLISLSSIIHAHGQLSDEQEQKLIAHITGVTSGIKSVALDKTCIEVLIIKLEPLAKAFHHSPDSINLKKMLKALQQLNSDLPSLRADAHQIQQRYFLISQLAVFAAENSLLDQPVGQAMKKLFLQIYETISNLHEHEFKTDYSEKYKTIHITSPRTYATYLTPWFKQRIAFEQQSAANVFFTYQELLHELEIADNKAREELEEQLRLLESQLNKDRISHVDSSRFDPSLANGSGSYMMGNIANAMIAQPFKEPRLLETAAVGTAAGYALPILKFVVIGGGISFIIYKLHKWASSDTSLESLKTKMEVMIARLDKDVKKANNHNFEATKRMIEAMENRVKQREREMEARWNRQQSDFEKIKGDMEKFRKDVHSNWEITLKQHEQLIKDWEAMVANLEKTEDSTARTRELAAMKKKIQDHRNMVADGRKEEKGRRKGIFSKLKGCFGTPEPGQ
jgi:hypothetical protein